MAYKGYKKEPERRKKYDPLYLDWLDRYRQLRCLRNVSRKYMDNELGLTYRTYYKKEVCISSFTFYELVKAFRILGYDMRIVVDDVFSHDKRGRRIDY